MDVIIAEAQSAGIHFLKLGGELRHDNAAPLERLIENWFSADPVTVKAAVIDLNELRFMDSTVIGLLAVIVRELAERGLPMATVFSTQPEINQLLHSLRLDEAVTLVEAGSEAGSQLSPAAVRDQPGQVSAASILRAHEQLIELNEANRAAFQPVVDLLRQG
ncbi:MAG: STAS domain-containing protein [Lysobacterales bacterium]